MSKAALQVAIKKVIKGEEERQALNARKRLGNRALRTKKGWKRRVVEAGQADVHDKRCLLCGDEFQHGDVMIYPNRGTKRTGLILAADRVFHAECLGVAADEADPSREFNRLRNRIAEKQEFFTV